MTVLKTIECTSQPLECEGTQTAAKTANKMEKLHKSFPDIKFVKVPPPEHHPVYAYEGFNPSETVLPKGHVRKPGRRLFGVETILERDVAIKLRDDVKLYVDVFRPAGTGKDNKVPAIIAWSPYGKTGGGVQNYDMMGPFRCGLPLDRTSGYESFEAPCPAEWTERGYAIVNADARGAGASEGEIMFFGQQEAEDIYDLIDWLSQQSWCSGVAMAGNSWLAIAQVNFISRLYHPALKAVAPWESFTDSYRDPVARGGIPNTGMTNMILSTFAGTNSVENQPGAILHRPFFDDYWKSSVVDISRMQNTKLPMYQTASYSTGLHSRGSFEIFEKAPTKKKWLRVHNTQEWYDFYRPEASDDLQRFFDFYCKGIENGWEKDTPPLRLTLLGFNGGVVDSIIERPEQQYPLAHTKTVKYRLDTSDKTGKFNLPSPESSASYESHSLDDCLDFRIFFKSYTELFGHPVVKLWMSCAEKDDMDVSVQLRKISKTGEPLMSVNYPCPVPDDQVPDVNVAKHLGPQGKLRASHSCTKSYVDGRPYYAHNKREPIAPGTIVPLEIAVWPIGMVFAEGEGLMVRVAGHDLGLPEVEMLRLKEPDDENVGKHVVHTGGKYDSYVELPLIS
ncbi:Alpha/Beta hydrolase protein [Phyllosticta paracitricarpa]|uniref:Alpha/Beta hydrolase protein n=1 Tax=Phyllosticta paracitricarpa TaxID=2016321 RepID=A0ABR1MX34_9PEZI